MAQLQAINSVIPLQNGDILNKVSFNTLYVLTCVFLDAKKIASNIKTMSNQRNFHKFDMEFRRRKMALFFYLIRNPIFNR